MIPAGIIIIDPQNFRQDELRAAADKIRQGGLVIIPTETVYGIAANLLSEKAMQRLVKLKERPDSKPFSLHIDQKYKVEELARKIPVVAYKLIERFWPGPLTVILNDKIEGKVGIRMPDDNVALKVIELAGVPVVCPSANLVGKPAPIDFSAAIKDLSGLVDIAINAGKTKLGIESTIVDLTVEPLVILREGAIKKEAIEKVAATKTVLFICTGNSCRSVMAEALLKKKLKEINRQDVEVASAGTMLTGGLEASAATKEVLAREGCDVSAHRSQPVTKEMVKKSDLILVMERIQEQRLLQLAPEVKNRMFLLKEFAKIDSNKLDIEDPIGKPLAFYEQTITVIKDAIERITKII